MYENIKTHKEDDPGRAMTNGCKTAVEYSLILVEKVIYEISDTLPTSIKGTNHMLNIVGDLNHSNFFPESILQGFVIICTFPSIDNKIGTSSVIRFQMDNCAKFLLHNVSLRHLNCA